MIGIVPSLHEVDAALLRPGRLGAHVEVPLPSEAVRAAVVKGLLKRVSPQQSKRVMEELLRSFGSRGTKRREGVGSAAAEGTSESTEGGSKSKEETVQGRAASVRRKVCSVVAKLTEGKTCADLEALVRGAAMNVMRCDFASSGVDDAS